MAHVQALICSLIFAVASLISPKGSSLSVPILSAITKCQNLGYTSPQIPIPLPTSKPKPIGQCEASPGDIAANAGIADITQKPIVLAPKNQPISEYNLSTSVIAYTHGIELRRFINYVQTKPGGLKEVHRLLTSPISMFPLNSGSQREDDYLTGETKSVEVTRKDDMILWSGNAASVKIVNTPNAGFTHLLVSSGPDVLASPEKIVYLVPEHPELTQTFQVVTQAEYLRLYAQYRSQLPSNTTSCFWYHGAAIPFTDPWNTVTPTSKLRYTLGVSFLPNPGNLAIPMGTCSFWNSGGWPVSYNTTATSFDSDGTDPVENISLTSHPYDCYCGGKTKISCATYTLTIGKKIYTLGNNFQFYKPLSGYMALLNGNLVLLYNGSLYEVPNH